MDAVGDATQKLIRVCRGKIRDFYGGNWRFCGFGKDESGLGLST